MTDKLHKIVNGKTVDLSEEEVAELKDRWAEADAQRAKRALLRYRRDREKEYPAIGDQLDAILKQLNYMQMNKQTDLIKEMDKIVTDWLAVKRKYPKPGTE